jgi:hypothetical protein
MSYVITTVRRKGDNPRTMTVDQESDRAAKSFCASLAAQYQRVTLHGMDADGILSVVGRWQGGHAKRGSVEQGTLPRVQRARPVEIIEGEVETSIHDVPPGEDEDIQADAQAAQEYLDETANEDEADSGETYEGYCVKCRQKREFHGHVEESDSGRRMAKGTCPECGTKMNRILANLPHTEQDWDEHDDDGHRQSGNGRGPVFSDSNKDEVKAAVVAAAEGLPAEEIAEAVSEVAADITEAVADAEQAAPAPARATRRPPRPRKGDVAKAKDSEAQAVADLPVAECFKCGQKQPVQERHGMRIIMTHSAPGIDRCPGSLTVVQ